MEKLKALAERRKIRKTLTVACLKERLSASRKHRELLQQEKRKEQELEEKQSYPIHLEQKSEADEERAQE
jgi:hypothetical protein